MNFFDRVTTWRINYVMKSFIKDACDLTYVDANNQERKKAISLTKCAEFFALTPSYEYPVEKFPLVEIGYNLGQLECETLKLFRKHWSKKYPFVKGFANVTLAILHELGHWETHDEVRKYYSWDDRVEAMEKIGKKVSLKEMTLAEANDKYFDFFDEACATEWAMMWLSDPNNRKIAKRFEKKFFALFNS